MEAIADAIRENTYARIARMCSEEAAKSLGLFSSNAVTVDGVTMRAVGLDEVPTLLGDPEEIMVGVNLEISGDISGYVLSSFNIDDAAQLVESLVGERPDGLDGFDDMAVSALGETGNIIVAALLRALHAHLGVDVLPCPPSVALDRRGAILTAVVLPILELGGEILLQEARIRSVDDGCAMSCSVLLLPTPEGWDILHKAVAANANFGAAEGTA